MAAAATCGLIDRSGAMSGRGWGLWSRIKLRVLADYLNRFTTASKKSKDIVYIDLFAGEPENFARTTGEQIVGSPRLALETTDPQFTKLAFFELPENAAKLEVDLRSLHPHRDFAVYPGDCNITIHTALADLRRANLTWAPTFAFIDPDGPDCHWTTLEALARHKHPQAKSKVEFWLLFPTMFMRQLPLGGALRAEDDHQIIQMFGTPQWREIYELRKAKTLSGTEARAEYINLMRWRVEDVLGYRWTHPLDIPNEHGVPIYTMIFATDHPAGTKIMTALYRHAAQDFPVMRKQAQQIRSKRARESKGILTLFDTLGDHSDEVPDPGSLPLGDYAYEPPWIPPGTA
jgi:three-Cys-motif partner protein